MKTLTGLLTLLLAIIIIGAVAYGGYYAVGYLISLYSQQEGTVQAILVTVFGSLVITAFIISHAIGRNTDIRIKESMIEPKLVLYNTLLQILELDTLHAKQAQFADYQTDILLLANEEVIELLDKIDRSSEQALGSDAVLYRLYQQLVKAMRRDLGHKASYRIYAIDNLLTNSTVLSEKISIDQ